MTRRGMLYIAAGFLLLFGVHILAGSVWFAVTQSMALNVMEPEPSVWALLNAGVLVAWILLALVTAAVSGLFPRLERDAMGRFR